MARRTVLLDDFDGKELPDDTQALRVVVGDAAYDVYLSEDNSAKFEKAIEPFLNTAERAAPRTQAVRSASTPKTADRERNKAARIWARQTGFEYAGADGQMRTLGERGRVPDVVIQAWEEAGEPK